MAPEFGKGYTSNGKANTVTVFDLKTLKVLDQIPVGKDPDGIIYEPVISFAASLPFDDPAALRRALRAVPKEVALRLANPLVRQLTTTTPDEMPAGGAVAGALDALASFKFIALRSEIEQARFDFAAWLGLNERDMFLSGVGPRVEVLADALRENRAADDLLEMDRELYHYLSEASVKASKIVVEGSTMDGLGEKRIRGS